VDSVTESKENVCTLICARVYPCTSHRCLKRLMFRLVRIPRQSFCVRGGLSVCVGARAAWAGCLVSISMSSSKVGKASRDVARGRTQRKLRESQCTVDPHVVSQVSRGEACRMSPKTCRQSAIPVCLPK
jgi:hypothetical protein